MIIHSVIGQPSISMERAKPTIWPTLVPRTYWTGYLGTILGSQYTLTRVPLYQKQVNIKLQFLTSDSASTQCIFVPPISQTSHYQHPKRICYSPKLHHKIWTHWTILLLAYSSRLSDSHTVVWLPARSLCQGVAREGVVTTGRGNISCRLSGPSSCPNARVAAGGKSLGSHAVKVAATNNLDLSQPGSIFYFTFEEDGGGRGGECPESVECNR
jgi:hypothetical protein